MLTNYFFLRGLFIFFRIILPAIVSQLKTRLRRSEMSLDLDMKTSRTRNGLSAGELTIKL